LDCGLCAVFRERRTARRTHVVAEQGINGLPGRAGLHASENWRLAELSRRGWLADGWARMPGRFQDGSRRRSPPSIGFGPWSRLHR
jgi:hypothetical protein